MAEAKNPSIKENKTDPLGGAGNTGGGPGQNNICGNVQLPLLAVCCANHSSILWGGWRKHSDILINGVRSKHTSVAGGGQT